MNARSGLSLLLEGVAWILGGLVALGVNAVLVAAAYNRYRYWGLVGYVAFVVLLGFAYTRKER